MSAGRLLRIAAIAAALPILYDLSQRVAAASGEALRGREWALLALSLLFFLRAFATEYSRGPEANVQKDLQWGLAIGGLAAVLWQWWAAAG